MGRNITLFLRSATMVRDDDMTLLEEVVRNAYALVEHAAGAYAGLVSRRSNERSNDDNFVITRPNGHAHAVVLAALLFAQQRIRFGIEEIGMRIERMQHSRNRAIVYGFVGVHRFRVVL